MKTCFFCKKEYPEDDFQKKYKDGTLLIYNKCVTCRKEWIGKSNLGWTKINIERKKRAIDRKGAELERLKNSLKKAEEKTNSL